MAVVTIPEAQRTIRDAAEIASFLAANDIEYERTSAAAHLPAGSPAEAVLAPYKDKIDEMKARGGYVTADVIDVTAATPNLDAMLNKFNSEHWHDEDEVRFIDRKSTRLNSS